MYRITEEMKREMMERMLFEEKSKATISKYSHDIRFFFQFIVAATNGEMQIDKALIIQYKEYLVQIYRIATVNSMLAALNYFLKMNGWYELQVKTLKSQQSLFRKTDRELTKEEYRMLLCCAKEENKRGLYFIMMTLAMTGIRISELPYITVENLQKGMAEIGLKGKYREIALPNQLQKSLLQYAEERGIRHGCVFANQKSGNLPDRSNILKQMKRLGEAAGVSPSKVFPHNFRHLFAVTYMEENNDVVSLADILGHSNINTTRRYTRISLDKHLREMEKMDLYMPYEEIGKEYEETKE